MKIIINNITIDELSNVNIAYIVKTPKWSWRKFRFETEMAFYQEEVSYSSWRIQDLCNGKNRALSEISKLYDEILVYGCDKVIASFAAAMQRFAKDLYREGFFEKVK